MTSATTHNTILPDGSINGLTLAAGESLVIRNYAGAESVPIIVLGQMSMDPAASLQIVLDGQPWGSTISFDSGIPVSLAGELDLTFAPGIDPTSLVGDTFQLFDWSGVNPNGRFQVVSNYGWDLSQIYSSGEVTLLAVTVPEPSTFAMLGVGACGLLACTWRRRRRNA